MKEGRGVELLKPGRVNFRAPAKALPWVEKRVTLILVNYQRYLEGRS